MSTRALVLGGGGPVGIAWEIGLAAGLEAEGVRLTDADRFVGTSAGSVVGAMLALGRSPQELLETQLSEEEPGGAVLPTAPDMTALMAQFLKMYTSEAPLQQLRAEMGAFALEAETMSEEEWVAAFADNEASGADWPERDYVCAAIDTADGSLVAWGRDSGVELFRAVASSCAVPGIFPPVTIKGRRYMDGGVGSTTNAGFARGYDRVLVVPVVAVPEGVGDENPMVQTMRRRFEAELDEVRESGASVEVVLPDAGSRAAFGMNYLDPARRRPSAEVGLRQGRAEAARLREFWG